MLCDLCRVGGNRTSPASLSNLRVHSTASTGHRDTSGHSPLDATNVYVALLFLSLHRCVARRAAGDVDVGESGWDHPAAVNTLTLFNIHAIAANSASFLHYVTLSDSAGRCTSATDWFVSAVQHHSRKRLSAIDTARHLLYNLACVTPLPPPSDSPSRLPASARLAAASASAPR